MKFELFLKRPSHLYKLVVMQWCKHTEAWIDVEYHQVNRADATARKVYCNSLLPGENEKSCDAPLDEPLSWGQTPGKGSENPLSPELESQRRRFARLQVRMV